MDGHVFQSDLMTDSTFPHKKLRMTTLAWNVNGDIAATAEKTKRKNVQFGTQSGTSPNKFGGRSTSFYAQRAHAELSTPQISVKSLQDLPNVMIALGQIKKNAPRMLNIIVFFIIILLNIITCTKLIFCAFLLIFLESSSTFVW